MGFFRGSLVACLCGWAVSAMPVQAAEAPAATPPHCYAAQIKFYQTLPNGQKLVSEPTLVTVEGRLALFSNEPMHKLPEGLQLPEPLRSGTRVELMFLRHQGKLWMYLKGNVTTLSDDKPESLRLATMGLSLLEAVTPGKPLVVPARGNELGCEILVTEVNGAPR